MTRASVSAFVVSLLLVATAAGATLAPHLRSATSVKGHLVVTFTLGSLAPARLVAAKAPATAPNGSFRKANIRLNEQLIARQTAKGYRARSKGRLAPGTYWVKVSARRVEVDCTPHKPCPPSWSNARRVTVK